MIAVQEPPVYVEEIDCSDIHPFQTAQEAELYKKLKGGNFMVIKEQNQNLWYVMPNADGLLVGSCLEN